MSILLAMLIDWYVGEPPAWLHPVVWMGRYLAWAGHGLPERPPLPGFVAGAAAWLAGALAVTAIAAALAAALHACPTWIAIPVMAVLLKPLFSLRLLIDEVAAVETALGQGLDVGRARLAHIVSRDTGALSAAQVRESALESLAENLSDSLVAPLFWFALLGLPGAALYRFANTADAMWGYRGRWEWAGKWAARADDGLSFVPARLTALGLMAMRPGKARALAREARRTPSPNGGWPMAAMAVVLGVRLGKPGVYVLNPDAAQPGAAAVQCGLRRAAWTGWAFGGLIALVVLARHG